MGGKLLSPFWGRAVRRSVFNLVAKAVVLAGALFGNAAFFASGVRAQALPPPFEYMTQVVSADEKIAIELLTVYEKDVDIGDKLLVRLATRGLCQRATFSGGPVADVSPRQIPHWQGKVAKDTCLAKQIVALIQGYQPREKSKPAPTLNISQMELARMLGSRARSWVSNFRSGERQASS